MLFFLSARRVSASSSGLSSTSRITRSPITLLPALLERKREGRALALGSLRPNPAAMAANNALDGGQTDAASGEILRRVKPLESAEKLVDISHVETGAIIADEVDLVPVLLRHPKLDSRLRLFPGELPRVAEQVVEHHPQQPRITFGREPLRDYAFDAALRLSIVKVRQDGFRHRAEVHLLMAHLAAADARQVQEIVDQLSHALGGRADAPEIVLGLSVQLTAVVLHQRRAEAIDAA